MSRRRSRFRHKGEEYVRTYRKGEKWINQCVCCQARGYDPDMPDIIMQSHFYGDRADGFAARYLKKHFKPLALDERGLCEVCSKR